MMAVMRCLRIVFPSDVTRLMHFWQGSTSRRVTGVRGDGSARTSTSRLDSNRFFGLLRSKVLLGRNRSHTGVLGSRVPLIVAGVA